PAPHGLPRIPIDVFISEPGFDQYQTRERSGTSLLAFAVNDDLTLRQNLRYSQTEVDYRTMYGQFPPTLQPNGDLPRVAYANKPELDALTMDNQAELLLGSGNIRHRVLAGVDYQHAVSQARSAFNGNAGAINVYNPVYGGFNGFSPADFNEGPENTVSQLGVYLQDEVTIAERWVTTLGIRRDETENRTEGRADQEDDAVTGRAALLYNADNGLSPYISYSESFQPVIGTNVFGESFKPLEGEQIEVGLKYQPPGSNSLYTAAIYDLRQKNVRAPDPNNPQNQIQTGEARSRGIELEALAEISPSWDVIAAYTYTDTEVLEGVNEGNHLASVPEQTASLWSQHDLTIAGLPGLRAGAGVRYVGDNYGGVDTLKTPGVTLFDAMLGYAVGRWDFRLNVNNIEDETYFTTCLTRGDCFVGTKRTVIGTVAVTF
ncbi:MAG: TonB-dependent receptor, partial [Marinobacter sp.]|uniref:TonB-dependent siderophore receptor n=1 Tax=Marinobacter sp. TaxID=50741 RepID=UPI00299D3013